MKVFILLRYAELVISLIIEIINILKNIALKKSMLYQISMNHLTKMLITICSCIKQMKFSLCLHYFYLYQKKLI